MAECTIVGMRCARKAKVACSVDGCDRLAKSRGMCTMHDNRFRRHGDNVALYDFGDPVERFHRKYWVREDTGCWEWVSYITPQGYGMHSIGAKLKVRAHRYSYELHHGKIPRGKMICHHCDNKKCVNPAHLYAGTASDNARDAAERGRLAKRQVKLTWPMVTAMRIRYARGGLNFYELAELFGVHSGTAWQIVKGRSWLNPPAEIQDILSPPVDTTGENVC